MRAHLCMASVGLLAGLGCSDHTLELQKFAGTDLRYLGDEDRTRLMAVLNDCIPESSSTERPAAGAKPWFLAPYSARDGEAGYILFEGRHIGENPGAPSSAIGVHFLAADGGHFRSSEFETGWRIDIAETSFEWNESLSIPIIELRTVPAEAGVDIRRQIYGVFGDRVALLRAEDSEGKLVANDYYFPNHTLGPPVPPFPAEEWDHSLRERGPARALEALTWIGGKHRPLTAPPVENALLEDPDSVRRVTELRQRPEIRQVIRRLQSSEHPWVREAAIAASKALGDPPDPAKK